MIINVRIVGTLIRPRGRNELVVDCDAGTTVAALLLQLDYSAEHVPHITAAVNGEIVHHTRGLGDGDDVILSMTVGGG